MRVLLAAACILSAAASAAAQTPDAGRQVFVSRCAGCHGSDGNGGELGPGIATRVPSRSDQDLSTLFRQGVPAAGMPAFSNLGETETSDLIRYLRTLKAIGQQTQAARSVADRDRQRAVEAYRKCVALGGPYAAKAREAISVLNWR